MSWAAELERRGIPAARAAELAETLADEQIALTQLAQLGADEFAELGFTDDEQKKMGEDETAAGEGEKEKDSEKDSEKESDKESDKGKLSEVAGESRGHGRSKSESDGDREDLLLPERRGSPVQAKDGKKKRRSRNSGQFRPVAPEIGEVEVDDVQEDIVTVTRRRSRTFSSHSPHIRRGRSGSYGDGTGSPGGSPRGSPRGSLETLPGLDELLQRSDQNNTLAADLAQLSRENPVRSPSVWLLLLFLSTCPCFLFCAFERPDTTAGAVV
jgi:hypothetical protein